MTRNNFFVAPLFTVLCALAVGHAEAVQRAHVASYGLDSNTTFNCDVAHPCRFFQAAITAVDPNGEVVALDSAGYGGVTITKSVSLVAPAGVYAGISVFQYASGVTINTPGVRVVLRGLTINGQGGSYGILMTDGASLSIENCVIGNLLTGYGVLVSTAANVKIIDTLLRNNNEGIYIAGGASATISRTTVIASGRSSITIEGNVAGTTSATISDSTIWSSRLIGIIALSSNANAKTHVSIVRSTVAHGGEFSYGVISQSNMGTALLSISKSVVTGHQVGLSLFGSGATLESLGNNGVRQNAINASGTITMLSPL